MNHLKILLLEDSEIDAEIVQRLLKKDHPLVDFRLCMTKEAYITALEEYHPDVILADNALPQFDATEALNIVNHLALQIPFILVTGTVSEEFAVDIIKRGADDYVLKDRLARLPAAIDTAIKNRKAEKEKSAALEQLVLSEEKYRMLFERNLAGVYLTTVEGTIVSCNDAFARILGYESHLELEHKNAFTLYFDTGHRDEFIKYILHKKQISNYESVLKHKNGNAVNILENITLLKDAVTGEELIEGVMLDFTEQKQMQDALLYEQYLMQSLMNNLPDAIYFKDSESRFLRVSQSQATLFGVEEVSKVLGKTDRDFFPKEHAELTFSDEKEIMKTGQSLTREEKHTWPDGTVNYIISTKLPLCNQQGDISGTFGISRDITEHKKAEILIQESEERYRTLVEQASDGIFIADSSGKFIIVNDSACEISGYSMDEVKQLTIYDLVLPENLAADPFHFEEMKQPRGARTERKMIRKDGLVVDVELSAKFLSDNRFIAFVRDISDRKKAEEKIVKANRLYSFISQVNQMIVRTTDENCLFSEICNIAVDYGKFKMAWIGLLDEVSMKVIPVRHAGEEKGYLSAISSILADDKPEGRGPTGKALREGKYSICNDIESDPSMVPWRIHALERGYSSSISLPIIKLEKVIGTFTVYAAEKHFFDEAEIALLQESTNDVSFALEVFEKERLRKKSEELVIANEKKFRKLVENGNDAFAILKPDGQPRYVSSSVERVLGYTEAEVYGMDMFSIIHPDNVQDVMKTMQVVMENPGVPVVSHLSRLLHKDGTYHWFEDTITNLLHDPDVAGIVDNFRDVTERVNSQAALVESEEKNRNIVENITDILCTHDLEGNILSVNLTANKYLGYEMEDMLKMNIQDVLTPVSKERFNEYIDAIQQYGFVKGLMHLQTNTGENRIWEFKNTLRTEGVAKPFIYGFAQDVTERIKAEEILKESEKTFSRIFYLNPSICSINDLDDDSFVDVNEAFLKYFGFTKEEVIGKTSTQLGILEAGIRNEVISKMDESGIVKNAEVSMRTKNGEQKDVLLSTSNIYIHDKEFGYTVANDITERKKAESAIKDSEEKYRTLVEQAFDGIIIYSPDGRIQDCNFSACNTMGYSREELKKLTVTQLFFAEDLEERPLRFKTLMAGQSTLDYRRLRKKDGSSVEMEIGTKKTSDGNLMAIGRDITERKKAEEKLNEEREKFAKIAATSPGLIYSFRKSPEGNFSFPYTSSAVEDLFGFTYEEIANDVGKILSLGYEEDIKRVLESIAISAETMKPWKAEFTYRHPKKGDIWLEGNSIPMMEPDGSIIWHGIIADITGKKKAEQEKEFTHKNLDALINNTSDLIWSIDKNARLISSNQAFEKTILQVTGHSISPGCNIPLAGFSDFELQRYQVLYDRALAGESFTEMVQAENFGNRWSEISFYPIYEGEAVVGTACFSRDITERKKAEEELQNSLSEKKTIAQRMSSILNTLPANIAMLDENGIIVDVNDAWKSFAKENGYNGDSYGVGLNYVKIAHNALEDDAKDGKAVANGISKILKNKSKEFVYEYPCHSLNVKRWFRMVATPVLGKGFTGAVVMHVDISALRKLEEERMENKIAEQQKITQAMILGQEKERNAIGKELHDNMNQILAGVNLLLGMLRSKPDRLQEYLTLCIDNINLAIKENRKIAHELVAPNHSDESIIELVNRLCRTMLQSTGLTTQLTYDDFDETLLTDDKKLAIYRILQEHCTNIVKHAEAHKVTFVLSTDNNMFRLKVKDDGVGMPAGKIADGIGLQNMKSRISILFGALRVDTKPGKGFTLFVDIPLYLKDGTTV